MQDKVQKMSPEIRFKGYTDDWVLRKLGDLSLSFEYGLNASSKKYDGKNKYIRITDIDEKTNKLNTNNITSPNTDLEKVGNYLLSENDILFARTGASVGKTYHYSPSDGIIYYAGFLIRAKIKKEYDSEFVFQNTLTDKYNNYVKITSQRSGQPGINAKEYANYMIAIPVSNINEQEAIGSLFKKLDDLIALQQRKIDTLKLLKKALLQQVFPENGEDIPKVRFSNFTDKWEQRNLNNIYKSVNEKNDLTLAKNRIISVAKMQWGKTPTESTDKYMRTYNVMRIGDIAFEGNKSKFFKYGRFVENTIGDGLISHVFVVFRPLKEMNLSYWKYFIHDESIMHNVLRMSTTKATMMTNLVKKDFLKQQIFVPNESEQKNIGELLDFLSSISKLSEKKLNSFELLKKTLLQKLFI